MMTDVGNNRVAMGVPDAATLLVDRPGALIPARVRYRHAPRSALRQEWPESDALTWLSENERELWSAMRARERAEAWLLGRLLAKQLLMERLSELNTGHAPATPDRIEIYSTDGLGRAVRPWVVIDGRSQPWILSIAHSSRSVLVALSDSSDVGVGVDLASIGAVSDAIVELWFTPGETTWVRESERVEQARRAATIWALKEAIYKATNRGDQFRPRQIDVVYGDRGEIAVRLDGRETGQSFRVRIEEAERELAVMVTVVGDRRITSV